MIPEETSAFIFAKTLLQDLTTQAVSRSTSSRSGKPDYIPEVKDNRQVSNLLSLNNPVWQGGRMLSQNHDLRALRNGLNAEC
jgi:hypothetical protein